MARKSKSELKTLAEQQETLNKEINPSGEGEAPAIQALLGEDFTRMNDLDALAIAKMVAKIVRGELKEELDGTMGKFTEKFVEMERTAKRWEEDRMKFAEEMYNLAEKTRTTTPDKLKASADGAQLLQKARAEASAEAAARRLELERVISNSPKINMVHPGVPLTIRDGDNKKTIMKPFEILYGHLRYVFQPNVPKEIPLVVYEHYARKMEEEKQLNKLKDALLGGKNDYGKAMRAEPAVDPNYAARLNETMGDRGISLPTGGEYGSSNQ